MQLSNDPFSRCCRSFLPDDGLVWSGLDRRAMARFPAAHLPMTRPHPASRWTLSKPPILSITIINSLKRRSPDSARVV